MEAFHAFMEWPTPIWVVFSIGFLTFVLAIVVVQIGVMVWIRNETDRRIQEKKKRFEKGEMVSNGQDQD